MTARKKQLMSLGPLIGLILLTFFLYIRVRGYEFVWDDKFFILQNPAVQNVSAVPDYFTDMDTMTEPSVAEVFRIYRPIRNLSYLVDFHLFGFNPGGWHLHNLLLHLVNGILIYSVARQIRITRDGSLFAAAIFLLHPVQTEVVAWVKCRDDLLSVLFALASLVLLLKPVSIMVGGAFHWIACLAKAQSVIVLPVVTWFLPSVDREVRWRNSLAFAVVSVLFLYLRHRVLGGTGQGDYLAGDIFSTVFRMGPVLLSYVRLIIWPTQQLADYAHLLDQPVSTSLLVSSWIGIVVIAVGLFWVAYRLPKIRIGVAWTLAAFLPVMNIVPMMQYMAERFLYMPMVGIAIAAGYVVSRLAEKSRLPTLCFSGLLVIMMSVQTHLRLPVWENNLTLFSSVVRDASMESYRPLQNLLRAKIQRGQLEQANTLLSELLQREWSRDQRAELLSDKGVLVAISGNPDQAIQYFTNALEVIDRDAELFRNRGLAYRETGQLEKAEEDFRQSLRLSPGRDTFLSLASLLWMQNRFAEVIEVYEEGLKVFPADQEMKKWLDRARMREKKRQDGNRLTDL